MQIARAVPQVVPVPPPHRRASPMDRATPMPTSMTMTWPSQNLATRTFSSAAAQADAAIFDVTEQNFAQMVQQSTVPIVLDRHAEWCGPCKQLAPMLIERINAANAGPAGVRIKLAKLDVDAQPGLAQALQVQSMPTVFAVAGGRVVSQFVGLNKQ